VIYQIINLDDLEKAGLQKVNLERLFKAGLIKDQSRKVKLLGRGEITNQIDIEVHQASQAAITKIKKQGGSVKIIDPSIIKGKSRLTKTTTK